jgi:DNA-binding transcriptional MerR regulator
MEYTVQKLGKIAGVSTRTLRYYDEIGILKPARINSSGYRIYTVVEVNRLQQILFYRELGVSLESIKKIIMDPCFNSNTALIEHREKLLEKRKQIDILIENINKTISESDGRITMTDEEKFEGLKQKIVDNNERNYGEEIRKKYGDSQIDKSNEKIKNMTKKQYDELEKLNVSIKSTLKAAFITGDPAGELAMKTVELHRKWISYYWDNYTKEAYASIAKMYVYDERFRAYYDKEQPGTAEFLRDAILIYTGMKK